MCFLCLGYAQFSLHFIKFIDLLKLSFVQLAMVSFFNSDNSLLLILSLGSLRQQVFLMNDPVELVVNHKNFLLEGCFEQTFKVIVVGTVLVPQPLTVLEIFNPGAGQAFAKVIECGLNLLIEILLVPYSAVLLVLHCFLVD